MQMKTSNTESQIAEPLTHKPVVNKKTSSAFKAEATRTEYSIGLNDTLDVITLGEINSGLSQLGNTSIDEMMDGMDGVDSVEHNGHFGNRIYFRISKEFDTQATHKAIKEVLEASMLRVVTNSDQAKEILLDDVELVGSVEDSIENYASERTREIQWVDEDTNTFAISYIGGCYHHEFKYRQSHDNKLEIYNSL